MLVLSRRPNEKVIFPNLGISVQVIRLDGKAVRLGIDAPSEIRVLREEIADANQAAPDVWPVLTSQLRNQLRSRLDAASSGLHMLHRRLEAGDMQDAESVIFDIFNRLKEIDAELLPAAAPRLPEAPGRRALVVEDNPNEAELLAAYLRMSGFHVDTVSDGLKALSYLKHNDQPDAVLLDMCMPRLNGPKTITSIRHEPDLQELKLFAVSGMDRQELGIDLGPRGVDCWFSKPVDANQLVSEMNRILNDSAMCA